MMMIISKSSRDSNVYRGSKTTTTQIAFPVSIITVTKGWIVVGLFLLGNLRGCHAFLVPSSSSSSLIGKDTVGAGKVGAIDWAPLTVHNNYNDDAWKDEDPWEDESWTTTKSRRDLFRSTLAAVSMTTISAGNMAVVLLANAASTSNVPRIDANNALAREFTAFPGLYPTIATKIVKGAPYASKKDVYAVLNEMEADRLKQYDKAIVIKKVDAQLKQFKTSQICKYECGNRVSSSYRDEQIKAVQRGRNGMEK